MQTSLSSLEILLLSTPSFRQGAPGLCDENSRWLCGAGYISQTSYASPDPSSTVSESFYKVHKHGTHAVQTNNLFSLNDPHHQTYNGTQFPSLILFSFTPSLLLFITSKCDLHHVEWKICGPATAFMCLYSTQHSVGLILIWDCHSVNIFCSVAFSVIHKHITHGLKLIK